MKVYRVEGLQACDPQALKDYPAGDGWPTVGMAWTNADDITVKVTSDDDGSGAHGATVEVYGPSRGAVLAYVADAWGTDDPDWFREYVEGRVQALTLADLVGTGYEPPCPACGGSGMKGDTACRRCNGWGSMEATA